MKVGIISYFDYNSYINPKKKLKIYEGWNKAWEEVFKLSFRNNIVLEKFNQNEHLNYEKIIFIEIPRVTELIKVLTPLFNKQGGLGMSFKKNQTEMVLKVPKNNDVTNLPFAPTKDAVEKYNKLGATTKYHLHDSIVKKKCPKAEAFAKRHLELLQHLGNDKVTESTTQWLKIENYQVRQAKKHRMKWQSKLQPKMLNSLDEEEKRTFKWITGHC